MRRSGVPFCRSEAVVTRAALLDAPGDPRQRKHGQAWAEEKFAEFDHARQPQAAVAEEPIPPPPPEPIRAQPAQAIERSDPPPADRRWDIEPSKHRYPRQRETASETGSEAGSETGSVRESASALLKLLRQPLDAIDRQEVKRQLAALREQGALMRARSAALAEQRRRRELEQ
jgi:flagellar biosynthesis/type III secretory pathway protein FliH